MKIKLDIDCTAKELRDTMGLPDVEPMQQAVLTQVQEQLVGYVKQLTPQTMMRNWMTLTPTGMQEMFTNLMFRGQRQNDDDSDDATS